VDLSLAPGAAADVPPFLFIDTVTLDAALSALPGPFFGSQVANRIWFERGGDFPLLTAFSIFASNSDIRGGSPNNARNQQVIDCPPALVTFFDPKRLEDLELNAVGGSAGGLIELTGGECYMQNVTVVGTGNGPVGPSPVVWADGGRIVVERCLFMDPGIAVGNAGFLHEVEVEDDNVLGEESFADVGGGAFLRLLVKGVGNFFSPALYTGPGTLDIVIGSVPPGFSGADVLSFGGGPFSFIGPGAASKELYPGGGNAGDAAPFAHILPASPPSFGINNFRDGIIRGVFMTVEGGAGAPTLVVTFYQAGLPILTEVVPILGSGAFVSTSFGFLGTGGVGDLRCGVFDPTGLATGTSINVSVLIK
jgi:hypothetical protein